MPPYSGARLRDTGYFLLKSGRIDPIIDGIPEDFDIFGPVKSEWALNYAKIKSADDLALDCASDEGSGYYRLRDAAPGSGPAAARTMNSPKWFTHRPRELLLRARRDENGDYNYEDAPEEVPKQAFFGLKACDISAMHILDRTFAGRFHDPAYERRRRETIIIGVDCFEPGDNCFCPTFGTGPGLKNGFDIGLSYFGDDVLVAAATDTGAGILAGADLEPAHPRLLDTREQLLERAHGRMTRAFDLDKAVKALNAGYNDAYWQEPSERCLSCANCINVCPTCYCYRLVDKTSIDLSECTRTRVWDACQHLEFAAVHGGNFRPHRADRLRQWVNHKLNWTREQYGVAGCVGCGRCITWCPTGIDITEPVRRLGGTGVKFAS